MGLEWKRRKDKKKIQLENSFEVRRNRVREVVVLDLTLTTRSVLLNLFHLLAQHYRTGVTARGYERPYRPIRPLNDHKGEGCIRNQDICAKQQGFT